MNYKYINNLIEMPIVFSLLVVGILLVLYGIIRTIIQADYTRGIWSAGFGSIITVMSLFLTLGYNNTAYYPSTADIQSSLTISNSCSSEFTLFTMSIVSIIIPFVIAYIAYCWRKMDKKNLTGKEVSESPHLY